MAIKAAIILCTLLLGCLAVPVPDNEPSWLYPENQSSRIVGGHLAPEGSHPWMAGLTRGDWVRAFVCGGSVIARRTILTAAHCIAHIVTGNGDLMFPRVTVGSNRWAQGGRVHEIVNFAIHEDYDIPTIKNDVAVLYTERNIVFNDNVRAISLNFDYAEGGIDSRVAGWGFSNVAGQGGSVQANLRQMNVRTLGGQQCVDNVKRFCEILDIREPIPVDPEVEICTFFGQGRGVCHGDSGSALVRTDTSEQIGVVSWGFPCARGAPDVYVRISAFQDWVAKHTRD